MRVEINDHMRDNPPQRQRNEAKAEAICQRLGVKKISRKLFEPRPGDLPRGRALDRRVRAQLLKGLCDDEDQSGSF